MPVGNQYAQTERHDLAVLTIDEARAEILSAIPEVVTEEVALEAAHGRILAEDVAAAHDVPPLLTLAPGRDAACIRRTTLSVKEAVR